MSPLPPGSARLEGFFEQYIQHSINHWNKGDLPYDQFVTSSETGDPSSHWARCGKAVRSGSMFYRYTNDPELRQILETTVNDLLTTRRENGSISCVPIENQPEESELWERSM